MTTVLIVDFISAERSKTILPVVDCCWMEEWTTNCSANASLFNEIFSHIPECEQLWRRGGYRTWVFLSDDGTVIEYGDNPEQMRQLFGWLVDD